MHFRERPLTMGAGGLMNRWGGITQFWDLILGGIPQFKAPIMGGSLVQNLRNIKKNFCGYAAYLQ